MAVQTAADKHTVEAKEHIKQAIQHLIKALDDETDGSDQFNQEYTKTLEQVTLELTIIKGRLL